MNASVTPTAGANQVLRKSAYPSIGSNAAFWAAVRALPIDFENDAFNEMLRDIVDVIDAHISPLRDSLKAQSSELAGLRARQVQMLCAPASQGVGPKPEHETPAQPVPQVEQSDLDVLAECEGLASGLIHNAGSPANTVAARKLYSKLTDMREAAADLQSAQRKDAISQLAMSFAKRHQSYDTFQNHTHRYLTKRLGAGEANDTVSSSLRLVRAAAIVARAFTVSGASMHDVVNELYQAPPVSSAAGVGEALIALAGVASAARLHLDSVGDEQLERLLSIRSMPSFYASTDGFPVPF